MTLQKLLHSLKQRLDSAANAPSVLPTAAWIVVAFLLVSSLGMVIKPQAFWRYFTAEAKIFDIGHYHAIAQSGYDHVNAAFYPLWPLIIAATSWVFGPSHAVLASSLLALAAFFLSLPICVSAFRQAMPRSLAAMMVGLYALNPNSLFHALSYPESLAALLSGLCLWLGGRYLCEGRRALLGAVVGVTLLLSLARPILPQAAAASLAAVGICRWCSGHWSKRDIYLATAIITGAASGYLIFGLYCLTHLSDFGAPFTAQAQWGRALGLHWELFYAPKAVANSDVVRLWDMQAFYGPGIIALMLWRQVRLRADSAGTEGAGEVLPWRGFLTWFAVFFAGCHAVIAFLTYPIFMSLGRHVFALPFIYYALGQVLATYWHGKTQRRAIAIYLLFSAAYLACWWERYGRAGWIG